MHVNLDGVAVDLMVPAIQRLLELVARQHPPGSGHESVQHIEFATRHGDRFAAKRDTARTQVEHDVAHLQLEIGPTGATQQRVHARDQLLQVGRLDDIVVGARLEAGDLVARRIARREDQHRYAETCVAKLAQHLEPAHRRQADIEDDAGVLPRACTRQSGTTVAHPVHLVPCMLERGLQAGAQQGIVLDEQQHSHGA